MTLTPLQTRIWISLSTRSRRALTKKKGRSGAIYQYRPRGHLLKRIASEQGLSIEESWNELQEIRKYWKQQD